MKLSRTIIIAMTFLGLVACDSENKENPTAPGDDVVIVSDSDALGAQPEETAVEEEIEIPAPVTEDEEGVISLNTVPGEQLPTKLAACVNDGTAGSVVEGSFTCNDQPLSECNDLDQDQKRAAKAYLEAEKAGYNIWGCSISEDESPVLHLYSLEGEALRVFNLALQKAVPEVDGDDEAVE